MYRAIFSIEGISPYSQSRQHRTPLLDGESMEDYDLRTWREKCNADEKGEIYVPAMAFKQSIDTSAKRMAIPDPDNRRATLTKFVVSEVICESHMPIGINKSSVPHVDINANVDGVRGSGKRVPRRFPQTPKWRGEVSFLVLNEKLKPDLLEKILVTAGQAVGVGQFRPEKGGVNGRFRVLKSRHEKVE